jgi:restriction system protein
MSKTGGYQNLIAYQLAVIIFDLNDLFVKRYIKGRTVDQMIQAARSGKQNIVEGSLEKSLKMNIKLTGVARASLGELLEDYRDFLRVNNLRIWDKNDPRVLGIRSNKSNLSNLTYLSNWTNIPERFSNLMITLISLDCYLLDRMIYSLEQKFITEGGYSENLFKKRLEQRRSGR